MLFVGSSGAGVSGRGAADEECELHDFTLCLENFGQFPTQRNGIEAKIWSPQVGKLINRISASSCPDGWSSSHTILEKCAREKWASKSACNFPLEFFPLNSNLPVLNGARFQGSHETEIAKIQDMWADGSAVGMGRETGWNSGLSKVEGGKYSEDLFTLILERRSALQEKLQEVLQDEWKWD